MLKLVPFNSAWISHDKVDIHAIYRRPRFVKDQYDEDQREYDANGMPTWDLTGPLPIKQHNKWTMKGFEYVTLANRSSLVVAAKTGTLIGGSVRDFDQHQTGGPWNYRKYAEGQQDSNTAEFEQLKSDVMRFGADAVEELRKRQDPGFVLPPALRALGKAEPKSEPKAGKDKAA